ncbi:uncharacterized protein LOC120005291 [Tripterygium wilfordii]|nr:uncharacterized protein LOC120005291 [Tripterygium wilfordii]
MCYSRCIGIFGDDADGSDNGRSDAGTNGISADSSGSLHFVGAAAFSAAGDGLREDDAEAEEIEASHSHANPKRNHFGCQSCSQPVRTDVRPRKQKKKPVSHSQLARSIHKLAATSDHVK